MKKLTIRFRFPTEKYPKPGKIILNAINQLPNKVKEYLVENPIIFSTEFKDHRANAFCIGHEDFKHEKHLIHLNHHVWDFDEEGIIRVIYHEIAHIYLKHKTGEVSYSEFYEEYQEQDKEADKLVDSWLKKDDLILRKV